MDAYLQHGTGAGPFQTQLVPCKEARMYHHRMGLSWTASGYGERLPTQWMVKVEGRWRRVYCRCFRNVGTLYIGTNLRTGTIVQLDY